MAIMDIHQILNNIRLGMKRNGPKIAIGGGTALMLGGAVWGCIVSVKKVAPLLKEKEDAVGEASIDEKEQRKIRRSYNVKVALQYAGPAACEIVGGTMIFGGTHTMAKRNVALAAAYATLSSGFEAYRERVVEKYGEDADRELAHGGETQKIEVTETDENGKTKKTKKTVQIVNEPSGYARYFADGEASGAERNLAYNETFLCGIERTVNSTLRIKGYLFLNDLYEMLGFERSIAGQSVGWVYDPSRDDHGDNYIKLRMTKVWRRVPNATTDEYEQVWMIDPNVDGPIMEHLVETNLITD